MSKPVFYDPERRRWRRLRFITDPAGIIITALIAFFVVSMFLSGPPPDPNLPDPHRSFKALKEPEHKARRHVASHRKTKRPPSEVALNSDEGIRAAYYVPWDEGSYSALKESYPQIDLLFPEWVHVLTPDGRLQALAEGNRMFDLVQGNAVRNPDDRHPVMAFLKEEKAQAEVFPLVNNFDPVSNQWIDLAELFASAENRAAFRARLLTFLASDKYRGISLDFEEIPPKEQPGFEALVSELASDLHTRGMKLYINLPPSDNDFHYTALAAQCDGIIVMDYDQHVPGTPAGPVSAQDWFTNNLQVALKVIPRQKLIAAIGNYGYDWPIQKNGKINTADVTTLSVQEAWLHAQESESKIVVEADSLNPHYGYMDDNDVRHEVWFLDAATALNEMRAARQLGINTFALWRLGAEDGSLWSVWDAPRDAAAPAKLRSIPPGHDVDLEDRGEILRITAFPQWGWRNVAADADSGLVTSEDFVTIPQPYKLEQYGWSPNKIAITFDDGPDPQWTPQVLDMLKRENASATFFLIGDQAEKFPGLLGRIYGEGHEIGNHTWTHPDVSNMSNVVSKLEMNFTERLFESKLGIKPLFFRPPYAIDEEPDTAEQVEPLRLMQSLGYITVGSKIDPSDWRIFDPSTNRRRSGAEMAQEVFDQLTQLRPGCLQAPCGNVVLLHDGGGDRSQTVAALPVIIEGLRARGFEVVPLSTLIEKQRNDVMVPVSTNERWSAIVDRFGFDLYEWIYMGVVAVFFLGNILMTLRLLVIGSLAVFDRLRTRPNADPSPEELPEVAVLIPAFNEEKVIVNTVRGVLNSQYPEAKLRAIVIDDGSRDATVAVARNAFAEEIRRGRLLVLSKANAGKAEALNYGLEQVTEPIFLGIDADTVIAPTAIARIVSHFRDPRVAAVAGNCKVGNRVNLWTRWQALEYITSQNFERRALDALGAVTVVPGALGAWLTRPVKALGGYHVGTVAEDADLTMSLLQAGYRVTYEDRALAYTEAPISANGLMRQRFRWSFGILQAVWKHRSAFLRGGVLGWLALPNIVIFQIILPIVSPAIDLLFFFGVLWYFADKWQHPVTANPASVEKLVLFFVIFLITDFIASVIAFALERREPGAEEDPWLLSQVWLQRFSYRQLFSLVLLKTLKRAVDGRPFSWDKLERTAAVRAGEVTAGA